MEALVTLLFFVALWGLALVLKRFGPRSPDLRKLSRALTGGPAQSETGSEIRSEDSRESPPPAPGQQHTPEAQPDTTTKPTP
ncbi:MAG TPA: hypothetical protein VN419_04320 [Humidesulfovibrio sp.]|uniref:hypothetical protein n=1 Tax=Humidesulfovibrio sp. TaxID=2910988 RepID=UPI002BDDBB85|nr:hypothetical protein [Humidesulfovibrio sp.]HWR03226.1 hypothetical protein [Humidesulfovibrio sp.]